MMEENNVNGFVEEVIPKIRKLDAAVIIALATLLIICIAITVLYYHDIYVTEDMPTNTPHPNNNTNGNGNGNGNGLKNTSQKLSQVQNLSQAVVG